MTRLAVGTPDAPADVGHLHRHGARPGGGHAVRALPAAPAAARRLDATGLTAAGVVLAFPLLTSVAARHVQPCMPTSSWTCCPWPRRPWVLLHRQRPSTGFWLCAGWGSALVVGFAITHGGSALRHGRYLLADALLLGACVCAAVGCGCWWAAIPPHARRALDLLGPGSVPAVPALGPC